MRRALPIPLLLLLACSDKPDDTADGAWTSYAGEETQIPASDVDPCAPSWDVQGAPALVACIDCVFVFDMTFTFDATESGEECAAAAPYTATYALQRELDGTYSLGSWAYGEIVPFAAATLDEETGRLEYYSQSNQDSTYYGYDTYYGYYGSAQIVGSGDLDR